MSKTVWFLQQMKTSPYLYNSWYKNSVCNMQVCALSDKTESSRMQKFKKQLRETTPFMKINQRNEEDLEKEPLKPWPNNTNPHTGEIGGPKGPEPTRYGDWERKGRVTDF